MNDYLKKQIAEIDKKIAQAQELLADPALSEMAQEEINKLEKQKADLGNSINLGPQSKGRGPHGSVYSPLTIHHDSSAVILEIRAAAGGNEAGLFASDLYRMYTKYAISQNWKLEELDRNEGGIGNIKEVVARISAKNAYQKLKWESGVHRVQRVPKTESSGRIHTSTATVAILPEVTTGEVAINPADIEFAAFRSGGHGGQNVNKVSTAVRIRHIPTGLIVKAQTERSQGQNREIAMQILRARLYQLEEEKRQSTISSARSTQLGTGDRSEKIRTYNFPQDRVTDHRLGKSWHNLERILDGDLGEIINHLMKRLAPNV